MCRLFHANGRGLGFRVQGSGFSSMLSGDPFLRCDGFQSVDGRLAVQKAHYLQTSRCSTRPLTAQHSCCTYTRLL